MDGLKDDRKEILAEVRSAGFDVKILSQVIKRRKLDRQKADELLALYESAIGTE